VDIRAEADAKFRSTSTRPRRAGERSWWPGNLPYHLSSPILIATCLDQSRRRLSAGGACFLQREVAERSLASPAPGARLRRVLSVLVSARRGRAHRAQSQSRHAFTRAAGRRIERAGAVTSFREPTRRGARRASRLPRAGQGLRSCYRHSSQVRSGTRQWRCRGARRGAGARRDRSQRKGARRSRWPNSPRVERGVCHDSVRGGGSVAALHANRLGLPLVRVCPSALRAMLLARRVRTPRPVRLRELRSRASVDGVVALRTQEESGHIQSAGGSEWSRFVIGSCCALAQTGAARPDRERFGRQRGHLWHAAAHIFPAFAAQFARATPGVGAFAVSPR